MRLHAAECSRAPLTRALGPEPATGVEGLNLRERVLGDAPAAARRAVQILAVDNDSCAVRRQLDVGFKRGEAGGERALEGSQRVFGGG